MPARYEYRRATAQRLGGFGVFTATGGTTDTILCPDAFESVLLPSDHLDMVSVLAPSSTAPRQKRVASDGLNAAGVITLEDDLGSGVGAGIAFEIHSVMPGSDGLEPGLSVDGAVDLALPHLLIPRTIRLTVVDRQYDYDISTYPWLDRPERLLRVREPNARGTTSRESFRDWELHRNGASTILHSSVPYRFQRGSGTVLLDTLAPADTLVNGLDRSTSPGFTLDGDTAVPAVKDVAELALLFCYAHLASSEDGARAEHYARLLPTQIAAARAVYGYDKDSDIAASFMSLAGLDAARQAQAQQAAGSVGR